MCIILVMDSFNIFISILSMWNFYVVIEIKLKGMCSF